jgi:hypothetical protein
LLDRRQFLRQRIYGDVYRLSQRGYRAKQDNPAILPNPIPLKSVFER